MALKEVPLNGGEQMMFKSVELGEVVRELRSTEEEKKDINEDFNSRIKLLKKRMYKLATEMKA